VRNLHPGCMTNLDQWLKCSDFEQDNARVGRSWAWAHSGAGVVAEVPIKAFLWGEEVQHSGDSLALSGHCFL
jgi:hypothetical protein